MLKTHKVSYKGTSYEFSTMSEVAKFVQTLKKQGKTTEGISITTIKNFVKKQKGKYLHLSGMDSNDINLVLSTKCIPIFNGVSNTKMDECVGLVITSNDQVVFAEIDYKEKYLPSSNIGWPPSTRKNDGSEWKTTLYLKNIQNPVSKTTWETDNGVKLKGNQGGVGYLNIYN